MPFGMGTNGQTEGGATGPPGPHSDPRKEFVLIVCAHKTSRKEIGEALNILGPSKLLGLVFNHDDGLLESYGYRNYLSYSQSAQQD